MKRKLIMVIGASACFALAGCISMSTGGLEAAASEGGAPTVRIDDSFFAQHVTVEDVRSHRTEMGFLAASVYVRNRYAKDFPVQYKFTWFDANGMEVQPNGRPWEQTMVHGGEGVSLAATAPEVAVTRFVVRMRRMK